MHMVKTGDAKYLEEHYKGVMATQKMTRECHLSLTMTSFKCFTPPNFVLRVRSNTIYVLINFRSFI